VNYLETLQDDILGALGADADNWFAYINLAKVRSLQAANEAAAYVAGTKKKSGKAGLCVTILMPTFTKPSKVATNILGVAVEVRVTENPTINHGTFGTGIAAEECCQRVASILDRLKLRWTAHELLLDPEEVAPNIDGDTLFYPLLFTTMLPTGALAAVAEPTITVGASTVTLACATASANIYYTTDGETFPSAANNATLYSAPFTKPAAGTLIRVAAYKAGYRQSNIVHQEIP
jgi:hypothetical protein